MVRLIGCSAIALMASPGVAQETTADGVRIDSAQVAVEANRTALPAITSLRDAIATAYNTNPTLLSERALARASDYRLAQARSLYGPTLDVIAAYGYTNDRIELPLQPSVTQRGFAGTASLVLRQPLFASGALRAGEQSAQGGIDFARQRIRLVESQTLFEVISSYVAVRREAALLDIAQGNLTLLSKQLRDNQARFEFRDITQTDLDQIRTRVSIGLSTVDTARGALGISRGRFVQSVGAAAGDLSPMAPLPPLPPSLEQAYELSDRQNALVQAARARERISRSQVRAAEAELGPKVDLEGRAQVAPVVPYNNDLNTRQLRGQVTFTMPLYDSGFRTARVREAKAANDSDMRLIDQSAREARQNVKQNWETLASTRASLVNLKDAVDAAQGAYDGAAIQERNGARTTLDVLDLARDLLDARSRLVSAQAAEYLARAGLLSSTGQLEGPLLFDSIDRNDPAVHLADARNDGDTPPLTQIVRALDGLVVRELLDLPSQDSGLGTIEPGLPPVAAPAPAP